MTSTQLFPATTPAGAKAAMAASLEGQTVRRIDVPIDVAGVRVQR